MGKIKKIALVTSTSNFERYRNIVTAVHKKLKEMGGYSLYVLTCYGLFTEKNVYDRGEESIYSLLKDVAFDGCIVESNLGMDEVLTDIISILKHKKIPFVTINFGPTNVKNINQEMEDFPSVTVDAYSSVCELLKHLIEVHNCKKINLVPTAKNDGIVLDFVRGYRDTLQKYGILVEENRIITRVVNINNGRKLLDDFKEAGVEDAEATVCLHDVHSIGLCLEMEARGLNVPDDMLICSMNRSTNSVVFRPDISGVDRRDWKSAERACELLADIMAGKEVPMQNFTEGQIYFGRSCGCHNNQDYESAREFQQLVLAKIEVGNQIRQMMQYNDSLDEVESIEILKDNLHKMFRGINCPQFILCLNQNALDFISSNKEFNVRDDGRYFDYMMQAFVGYTERTGELGNARFPISHLIPFKPKEGDMYLFYPIHHNEQVYGYLTFVNEYLPVELYNYRICHESIGNSMENLHRKMVLSKMISKLDELYTKDAMTGLYNRFAWDRFKQDYIDKKKYTVIMVDMDDLKKVNDHFGHSAGDNAISIIAKVLEKLTEVGDLVTRYGGDEFRILSNNTDGDYWLNMRRIINEEIMARVHEQKLPYTFGVSVGYSIVNEEYPLSFEECCEKADFYMYEDKRERKSKKKEQ